MHRFGSGHGTDRQTDDLQQRCLMPPYRRAGA